MRKKLPALALACFLVFVAPLTASAHPGRTDSSGGHTDHSAGEYHYHHGYEAHQHYDMDSDGDIDCPYDFDDQTKNTSGFNSSNRKSDNSPTCNSNEKSENSTSKSSHTQATNPKPTIEMPSPQSSPRATTKVTEENNGGMSSMFGWLICVALGIALIASLCHNDTESRRANDIMRGKDIAAKLQKDEYEEKLSKLSKAASYWESKANEYQSLANDLQAKLNECESELSHVKSISLLDSSESPEDKNLALSFPPDKKDAVIQQMSDELKICKTICRIPKSVSFHHDGMPIFHNPDSSKPYGDWTVYINRKSGIYHLDYFCFPYSSEYSHLFNVLGTDIRPCKKCASGRIRLSGIPIWYTNYLEVKPKAKELGLLGIALSTDFGFPDSMQREDRSDFYF